MSIGIFVSAVKPPDDKWLKMRSAYDACLDAGIEIPKEVKEFFNWCEPDPDGVVVNLSVEPEDWGDTTEVYSVDISELPKDTKIIRFSVSY